MAVQPSYDARRVGTYQSECGGTKAAPLDVDRGHLIGMNEVLSYENLGILNALIMLDVSDILRLLSASVSLMNFSKAHFDATGSPISLNDFCDRNSPAWRLHRPTDAQTLEKDTLTCNMHA